MVFAKRLRERVRHGEITCTVRIWMRPHVRVGGRYRMEGGEIEVNSIETIGCPAITPELARKSRFRGPGSAQVGGAGQRREHLLNPLPLCVAASRQGQSNSSKTSDEPKQIRGSPNSASRQWPRGKDRITR
jgi:hypothetical protein